MRSENDVGFSLTNIQAFKYCGCSRKPLSQNTPANLIMGKDAVYFPSDSSTVCCGELDASEMKIVSTHVCHDCTARLFRRHTSASLEPEFWAHFLITA